MSETSVVDKQFVQLFQWLFNKSLLKSTLDKMAFTAFANFCMGLNECPLKKIVFIRVFKDCFVSAPACCHHSGRALRREGLSGRGLGAQGGQSAQEGRHLGHTEKTLAFHN